MKHDGLASSVGHGAWLADNGRRCDLVWFMMTMIKHEKDIHIPIVYLVHDTYQLSLFT
jgi:hypothetical protein